jgi:molybdopterin biosynthesis enzyme
MIRPEQALSILAEAVHPLEPAALPLGRAAGAFLASPVHARLPFPPRAVAAMDGYAVRVQEAQSRVLPVAFTVKAGELPPPFLRQTAPASSPGPRCPKAPMRWWRKKR